MKSGKNCDHSFYQSILELLSPVVQARLVSGSKLVYVAFQGARSAVVAPSSLMVVPSFSIQPHNPPPPNSVESSKWNPKIPSPLKVITCTVIPSSNAAAIAHASSSAPPQSREFPLNDTSAANRSLSSADMIHFAPMEGCQSPADVGCWSMDSEIATPRMWKFPASISTNPERENLNVALIINVDVLAARGAEGCFADETGNITIDDDFCAGLRCRSVSFEGAQRVVSFGNNMLRSTTAERISFGPLTQLTKVGRNWMDGCQQLTRLDFACDLSLLKRVGDGWLRGCSALPQIDFDALTALESVGCFWMEGCDMLTSFHVQGLTSLLSVGSHFLAKCARLEKASFTDIPNLTTVGDGWLQSCPKLRRATFDDLPRLSVVGSMWMAGCRSIRRVSLLKTNALHYVGTGWLLESDAPELLCDDPQKPKIQHLLVASLSSVMSERQRRRAAGK